MASTFPLFRSLTDSSVEEVSIAFDSEMLCSFLIILSPTDPVSTENFASERLSKSVYLEASDFLITTTCLLPI